MWQLWIFDLLAHSFLRFAELRFADAFFCGLKKRPQIPNNSITILINMDVQKKKILPNEPGTKFWWFAMKEPKKGQTF